MNWTPFVIQLAQSFKFRKGMTSFTLPVGLLLRVALYHRHLVVYCENCTCNSYFKTLSKQCPLKTHSVGLRCTIAIWWFTDRNCTCNTPIKSLDGGIEAQPNGAVEIVPWNTRWLSVTVYL